MLGLALLGGSAQAVTTTVTYHLVDVVGGVSGPKFIAGKALLPWITKGTLPVGSILRSVAINTTLQGVETSTWVSDLCVYVDPTPTTVGDDGLLQVGGSYPFGSPVTFVNWTGGNDTTIGSRLVDQKSAPADFPADIDLNTAGLYLGNADTDSHWSGTLSVTYDMVGPADIINFGLPGNPGVVGATSITLTAPYGTDVTTLTPNFTMVTGATCPYASGSPHNFTNPVTYAVTAAGGGTHKDYIVTVVVTPASTAKDIESFGPGAIISGTNIAWTVPFAANVTTLTPIYTISTFASEDPAHPSGTACNFTTPQTFTITAQDHSTKVYTVTVTKVPASSSNDITAFAFSGLPAVTISGTSIIVTVPYVTDLTTLTPDYTVSTFALEDAAHPSGAVRNFTTPQTYTITAQTGATKVYTVTVTLATPSSNKNMLTFGPGGIINGTDISWTLPFGTDVTNLAPTYTLTLFALEDPLHPSGSLRNFTTPQAYTIHAEDGTTKVYTVTVTVIAMSSAKDILTFGPGGAVTGTNILWTVPVGTNVTTLSPTYTISPLARADSSYPSGSPRNFTTPQTYTLTAEDGSTKNYTVTVTIFDGLVAYLPLDGDFQEVVSDNDLTPTGTPTFVTGKIGQAVKFTSSQRARRATTTNLPTGDGEFTWASWFILDTATGGFEKNFFNWGLLNDDRFCAGGLNTSGFIRNNHTALGGTGDDQTFTYQPTAGSSNFVHVALVYQNTGGVREQRLYVNGVLNSSAALTGPALNLQNSDLTLNGRANGSGTLNGQLDDVGIWSVTLSASKIAAIHGLGHFSSVPLNDKVIAQVLAMNTAGQSVSNVGPNHHIWAYRTGLIGATGTISGSVAGGDAYIVLNSTTRTGVALTTGSGSVPRILIEQPLGTNINNSSSKDFGAVTIGSNTSLAFTIRNTGTAILTGLTITKDGSNTSDFVVTTSPVAPVNSPTGTTTFVVRFAPGATGARSATLHLASNDSYNTPFNINLTGTGGVVSVPFTTWINTYTSLAVADRDPAADPDHDGANNLAEFAFNGVPNAAASHGLFFTTLKDNNADGLKELTLTCAVRRSTNNFAADSNNAQTATIDGVTYIIEASATLSGTWNSTVNYIGKSDTAPAGSTLPGLTGADWEYRSFSAFNNLGSKGFLRARVSKQP